MGPQDPKDVVGTVGRDLARLASDLVRTKADANHWLREPQYAALRPRLENAHAAAEAALIEARRRVRMNEGRDNPGASVTNAAEEIAAAVVLANTPPTSRAVFVEHYEDGARCTPDDRATLNLLKRDTKCGDYEEINRCTPIR